MSKTNDKVAPKSSSFGWANGEPVRYKDASKALQKAHALASDVLSAHDDDFKALVARKRKKYEELKPKKRQRMKSTKGKNDSIGSTACSETTHSTIADEDIEWSDCDELELSRNISILEQSINQASKSSDCDNDNELEWSDCDEAELSRNISLLEQSRKETSDRETLKEISNL